MSWRCELMVKEKLQAFQFNQTFRGWNHVIDTQKYTRLNELVC